MKRVTIELSDPQFLLLQDQANRSRELLQLAAPEDANVRWTVEDEALCSLMIELRRTAQYADNPLAGSEVRAEIDRSLQLCERASSAAEAAA